MKPGTSLLNQQVANALKDAIETTLNDTFQIATHMEAWTIEKGPLALEPFIVCTIKMQEPAGGGMFMLAFSHETITKVLATYGIADINNAAIINDAAEEITNMIYGMLKTSLNKMGHCFIMEIPQTVLETREFGGRYRDVEKMVLPFLADGHRCRVMLASIDA